MHITRSIVEQKKLARLSGRIQGAGKENFEASGRGGGGKGRKGGGKG
jgi:hypothetical protein